MTSHESVAPGAEHVRPAEVPRQRAGFGLRFEAGRGIVVLARPLAFPGGVITSLEIDLGRLPSPIDLRQGASRFRNRRATLRRAAIEIDLDAVAHAASTPSVQIRVLGTTGHAIAVALRDPLRTIALELVPAFEGRDLLLVPRGARAALEGPRVPMADAVRALGEALGAALDPVRGALRVADPLRDALTEALVPHGWRVPDARALAPGAIGLVERTASIVLHEGPPIPEPDDGALRRCLEEARIVAPLLVALAGDRAGEAEALVLGLETQRMPEANAEHEALLAEVALASGRPLPRLPAGLHAASLRLRDALRRRDVERAACSARELAAAERCDDLAIEALRAASAFAATEDPATAADLSARALARRPADAELALEWLERAARLDDPAALVRGVREVRARVAGPRRAEVLRSVAAVLERAGEATDARACWEEASQLDPDDPEALEGLARTLGREGLHERALQVWDRVASTREGDPDGQARAAIRAAEHARALGHAAGAAMRLERAAADARDEQIRLEALSMLAATRRALGLRAAAAEADAALLTLAERLGGPAMIEALLAAAHAAIEERAEARARAMSEAARRAGADEAALRALDAKIDAIALEALEAEAPEHGDGDPATRALAARRIAERLRGAGRFGDAARALARAGVLTRDAATLRAALELADKAGRRDVALEVVEQALEVVAQGPGRAALEARRRALREQG